MRAEIYFSQFRDWKGQDEGTRGFSVWWGCCGFQDGTLLLSPQETGPLGPSPLAVPEGAALGAPSPPMSAVWQGHSRQP